MAGEAATKAITQNPSGDSNPPLVKKKRNLPGTPDPDAEVIALTPKTLMATNRFLCEICGKGFQRDQNLQLHRRGHNLPWKLRQRSTKEPRKRVYVCPEKTCVHNHPSRALGDLTGIKKHFCRKHGEKKWKCDKCSKRYAVQSDWKAHSKTCGTREYRCDCGTLFSRRDSFVTHRAFCDALAEETARVSATANINNPAAGPCGLGYHLTGNAPRPSLVQHLPSIFKPIHSNNDGILDQTRAGLSLWMSQGFHSSTDHLMSNNLPDSHHMGLTGSGALQADPFGSCLSTQETDYQMNWVYGKKISCSKAGEVVSSTSLPTSHTKEVGVPHLASVPSLYSNQHHHNPQHSPTDMSATALLQKAAQMGATSTTPSLFGSFGAKISSSDHSSHLQGGHKFEGVNQSFGTNMPAEYHCLSNLSNMTSNQSPPMYPAKRPKSQKDDLEGGETRDFLGVGVPTLCPPSTQGWI